MTMLYAGTCGPVVPGTRITQPFGYDPSYQGNDEHLHYGIDFGVWEVVATAPVPFRVVKAGWYDGTGYGIVVLGEYTDEEATWYVLYAHLKGTLVRVGDFVQAGQAIGITDNTGHSFGAHLHFARGRNGYSGSAWVDPLPWLLALPEDDWMATFTEAELTALHRLAQNEPSVIYLGDKRLTIAMNNAFAALTEAGKGRLVRRVQRLLREIGAELDTLPEGKTLTALVYDLAGVAQPAAGQPEGDGS